MRLQRATGQILEDEELGDATPPWTVPEADARLAAVAPLVFLPGAGGSASFWRPVADKLADLGQLHLFGYPGFAGLPADPRIKSLDDLFGWLVERLPPGASHVIAQSMGGVLAARLALERPERVTSLVLVATSGGVDVARLGAAEWRHEHRALQPDAPTWFIDDRTDLTDRLAEIRARTLLLWSDADPISPLSVAQLVAGRIPGACIATVAGGTHSFASERAEEVASIIRSHLAERRRAAADRKSAPRTCNLKPKRCK